MRDALRNGSQRALLGVVWLIAQLPLRWLISSVPLWRQLLWPFVRKRRAVIARNLEIAFPTLDPVARVALLRNNVDATFQGMLESLVAFARRRPLPARKLHIEGLDCVREALAEGRGALLLGAHFTSLSLLARALHQALAVPLAQIVRRHSNPTLEHFIDAGRRAHVGPTISKEAFPQALRALRKGQLVALAADQNFNRHGCFAPFFGVPAASLDLRRILRVCACPVILTHIVYDRAQGWTITLRRAPENFTTQAYLLWLGAQIQQAPAQYLWAHRRYRNQPDGAESLYASELLKRSKDG